MVLAWAAWRASRTVAGNDADGGELAELGGDLGAVVDRGVVGQRRPRDDCRPARDDDALGIGQGRASIPTAQFSQFA